MRLPGVDDDLPVDGERDLALAVRQAVLDDGAWSPERLGALAERADRRAARRRRRRLVAAPLATVVAAAAVAVGLLVVPPLVAADRTETPATGGPLVAGDGTDPAVDDAAVGAGRLTTDEVRTVVAGAQPQPAPGTGESEDTTLRDACGTAELTATRPLERQTGTWQAPWTRQLSTQRFTDAPSTDREMASPPLLRSQVDTYADDATATAAALQLRESVRTCRPAPGASQPTYPVVREVFMADASYGMRDQPAAGQYTVTAVQVRGNRTASVTAVVDGVHDQQTQEQVATQVAHLAAAAASRAEAQGWLVSGPNSSVPPLGSPVTTEEVQRLVPGAQPTPEFSAGLTPSGQLDDACGTAPLTGVAEPVWAERSVYTDPELSYVDFQPGFRDDAATAMGRAAVVVSAADLGTPADARAYATAFRDSTSTCTPQPGVLPPSQVDLLPVDTADAADALVTTAYDEGAQRYWYAAVVVRGSHAATVLARVPGAPSRDVATAAAQRTVDLATAAADRAATDDEGAP